jgi:hypothetical protein
MLCAGYKEKEPARSQAAELSSPRTARSMLLFRIPAGCPCLGIGGAFVGTLAVHTGIPGKFEKLRRIAGIATLWVFMGSNCEQFTLSGGHRC